MLATPLMVAAGSGEGAGVETMHLLLRMGADSSFVSEPGSIARYAAAGLGWNYQPGGDALRLQLCLELGCDPNEVDPRGVTLLADAAMTGDVSRVQVLVDAGASPNADRSVIPPNFSPMADSPFDEDAPYSFRIPLHNAVDADEFEMVRLILAAGADVHALDQSRQSALFRARSPRVAQLLIDTGLNVEARDCLDWSSLVSAIMDGERDVVSALIAVGADVNATHDHGFTVFMSAVSSSERCLDIIDALVDAGADPLAVSDFGWNAFHAAIDVIGADANLEDSVRSTLERLHGLGVDINHKDVDGWRPLDLARHLGTKTEVALLLELGAMP